MGKVFMWEEIENRMIPQLASFERVAAVIRSKLEDSSLIGGVICGSVNYGHHNVRSDIDCLVLYPEEAKPEMVEVLLGLTEFADGLYVPIDFIQVTPELAATNIQGISPSMAQHIRCSASNGGLIKANPFEHMSLQQLDSREEAISWTRQKIRMLDEGAVHHYPEQKESHYLQKMLEAPINGTRKLLLSSREFEDDSKAVIVELARSLYPELYDELDYFCSIDKGYTGELARQVEAPDEAVYCWWLSELRTEIEGVARYLKKIGQLLES